MKEHAIYPERAFEESGGLFRIVDGRVEDLENFWGLGENPLVDDFVNLIENKIDTIKNWIDIFSTNKVSYWDMSNKLTVFPNPLYLNNILNITYSFTYSSKVIIELTNSLGIRVAEIYDGFIGSGENTINYEADPALPTGAYWIRMIINGEAQVVKQLIILR